MDDIYNAILGDQSSSAPQKQGFDTTKSYGTPSQILDNLKGIESSGDAFALNPDTKAMGNYQFTPETAQSLNKQGIKFNPFDAQESRAAADYSLNSLYQKTGSWEKALAIYGGFVKKDPSKYVAAAMKGVDTNSPATTQAKQPYSDDPIYQGILGGQEAPTAPVAAVSPSAIPGGQPQTQQPTEQPSLINKYVTGPAEAALAVGAGTVATPIATGYGILKEILKGEYGQKTGEKYASEALQAITSNAQPKTEGGKEALDTFNKWFEESKLAGLGPSEAGMLAQHANVERFPNPKNIPAAPAPEPAVLRPTVRGAEVPEGAFPQAATNLNTTAAEAPAVPMSKVSETVATGDVAPGESANISNQDRFNRAQVLHRVGQISFRDSALDADPLQAATEAQMTNHNEPAGQAALDQFTHEKDALSNYTSNLINEVGGSHGIDEASLHERGKVVAKPFDDLRNYYENAVEKLYNAANEKAAGVSMDGFPKTKELLDDTTTYNSALAAGQANLVDAIKSQMNEFVKKNDGQFNVKSAEDFRKWLNENWTPDNSKIIGKVKDALDQDVLSSAGGDIYKQARALHQLKINTLDDPKGISKMFEFNKFNPLNRTTAYDKIPDALTRLDPDQFNHIVTVLKQMPEELQPEAQAALGEIKGHYLNRILDSGSMVNGTPNKFWSYRNVNKLFQNNSSKMPMVFSPEEMERVKDIRRAGNINSVNSGYPGAAAAAANAVKAGLMTKAFGNIASYVAGGAGGFLGGAAAGPTGGALGALGAKSMMEHAAAGIGEKAAKRSFKKGLTNIKDIGK